MQNVIDMLESGKTVDEVREIQLKKLPKKAVVPKKAAEPVKAKLEDKTDVMSESEVNEQAEAIIAQIKAASSEIKEVEQEQLVQLDSDMEPEDELALGYMIDQFPKDYNIDKDSLAKNSKKVPSQAEIEAKEKQEMVNYA